MQKTAILIAVITKAVAHFSVRIVVCVSEMMDIRLMIICISSWISKTQKNKMKNSEGTLYGRARSDFDAFSGWKMQQHDGLSRSLCVYNLVENEVAQNQDSYIGENFTPYHVNIRTSSGIFASPSLLDCLPDSLGTFVSKHCNGGIFPASERHMNFLGHCLLGDQKVIIQDQKQQGSKHSCASQEPPRQAQLACEQTIHDSVLLEEEEEEKKKGYSDNIRGMMM